MIMCSIFGQSGLFTSESHALLAGETIFDFLGMLDSGERSSPFERFVYLPVLLNATK